MTTEATTARASRVHALETSVPMVALVGAALLLGFWTFNPLMLPEDGNAGSWPTVWWHERLLDAEMFCWLWGAAAVVLGGVARDATRRRGLPFRARALWGSILGVVVLAGGLASVPVVVLSVFP